ncbi:unnamed protein product, partial [marine sediment metagenome]
MTEIPIEKWFGIGGLTVISFPVEAEYFVLNQIRNDLGDESLALIHSKPVSSDTKKTILIDA